MKTEIFKLNVTLKCGNTVYLKGTIFNATDIPTELKEEVLSDSGTISVISYGDDEFDPDKSITLTQPKKKLKVKKKILK